MPLVDLLVTPHWDVVFAAHRARCAEVGVACWAARARLREPVQGSTLRVFLFF